MSPLTLADLLLIAGRVLDLDTGEVLAITDLAAAEAALATAADAAGGPEQAAALLCELLWRRPFTRGNQRVAVVAALQQLATHGYELDTAPPQALPALVARITAGTTDREEVAAWLADRLLPRSSKEYSMFERLTGRGGKGPALFTRFTKLARQAVVDAQEEARRLEQDYVGTEHVLLGLIRQRDGIAAGALDAGGVSLEAVRAEVEVIVGRGQGSPAGHIPFTPRAKKVLELSLREALQLGHNYIGTEHILLGLIREGEGVAAQVLVKLGADLPRVRQQVIQRVEEGPRLTAERKELLLGELASVFDDNERLRAEVQRLRDLLREHGVDPDNGASRTA